MAVPDTAEASVTDTSQPKPWPADRTALRDRLQTRGSVLMLRFTPHHYSVSVYTTLKVSVRKKCGLYTLFSTVTHKTACTAHLLFVIRHTIFLLCSSFLPCVCVSPQVLAQQETDRSKELPGGFGSPQKSPRKSPGSKLRSDLQKTALTMRLATSASHVLT